MSAAPETVRILRVFVSSPGDVAAERAVLDEVVESINRSDGRACGVRLELWKWEQDAVPQIGPQPQAVIDAQTPAYDIYLGILAHRFGTTTGRYGSGTEKEFRDALKRWGSHRFALDPVLFQQGQGRSGRTGSGAVCQGPQVSRADRAARARIVRHVRDGAGQPGRFFRKGWRAPPRRRPPARSFRTTACRRRRRRAATPRPISATCWSKTSHIDIRGLSVGTGKAHRFPIEELFISLTASGGQAGADVPDADGRLPEAACRDRSARRFPAPEPGAPARSAGRHRRPRFGQDDLPAPRGPRALPERTGGRSPRGPGSSRAGRPHLPRLRAIERTGRSPGQTRPQPDTPDGGRLRRPGCLTTWPPPAPSTAGIWTSGFSGTSSKPGGAPCCWMAWTKPRIGGRGKGSAA